MRSGNLKFIWLIVVVLFSCTRPVQLTDHEEQSPLTPHQDQDTLALDSLIEIKEINWSEIDQLNQKPWINLQLEGNDSLLIDSLTLFSKNLLPRLYKFNGSKFIWTSQKNIEDAYRALELSYLDGLLPEDYHQKELADLKERILASTVTEQKQSLLAKHDIVLTDAMIMFGFHLLMGKVDPVSINPFWNYESQTISNQTLIAFFKFLKKQEVFDGLDQLRPKQASYKAMMNAIRFYHQQPDSAWAAIEGFEKLEIGDTNQYIPLVRKRLALCCNGNETRLDSMVFDSTLYDDIVSFQNQHGLYVDGVIGKKTLVLLNLTPEERLVKLRVNLERLRWLGNQKSDYFIAVNIAAFQAYVVKGGNLIYQCNVVTGKPFHKTPVFTKKLKYIDFNPTWTVPYSISSKELLPKMKKEGASYFVRNNMTLLDRSGKQPVDPSTVDFSELAVGKFPYVVRQEPGRGNALGVVKFLFPNRHSVYMHDTPSKSLFSKSSRAFSHGCIRVENPLDLAELILSDRKKWDREKMEKTIKKGKTTTVTIKDNIDVMVLYYTAGLFPDGVLFYLPDIYKRDQALLNALDTPFEYDEKMLERAYPDKDPTKVDSMMAL